MRREGKDPTRRKSAQVRRPKERVKQDNYMGHYGCTCCQHWAQRAISEINALANSHKFGDKGTVVKELDRVREFLDKKIAEVYGG